MLDDPGSGVASSTCTRQTQWLQLMPERLWGSVSMAGLCTTAMPRMKLGVYLLMRLSAATPPTLRTPGAFERLSRESPLGEAVVFEGRVMGAALSTGTSPAPDVIVSFCRVEVDVELVFVNSVVAAGADGSVMRSVVGIPSTTLVEERTNLVVTSVVAPLDVLDGELVAVVDCPDDVVVLSMLELVVVRGGAIGVRVVKGDAKAVVVGCGRDVTGEVGEGGSEVVLSVSLAGSLTRTGTEVAVTGSCGGAIGVRVVTGPARVVVGTVVVVADVWAGGGGAGCTGVVAAGCVVATGCVTTGCITVGCVVAAGGGGAMILVGAGGGSTLAVVAGGRVGAKVCVVDDGESGDLGEEGPLGDLGEDDLSSLSESEPSSRSGLWLSCLTRFWTLLRGTIWMSVGALYCGQQAGEDMAGEVGVAHLLLERRKAILTIVASEPLKGF